MTQQSVEILIGKLLTDEELREAFEQNPQGVLVWLLRQGLQLSRLEMEALQSIKPSDLNGLADMIDRRQDRKSTRLNSSHLVISYAVFCLKKKTSARRRSPASSRGRSAPPTPAWRSSRCRA